MAGPRQPDWDADMTPKDVRPVDPALAASVRFDPSPVDAWMAEHHDIVPAVLYRPVILERDEPGPFERDDPQP